MSYHSLLIFLYLFMIQYYWFYFQFPSFFDHSYSLFLILFKNIFLFAAQIFHDRNWTKLNFYIHLEYKILGNRIKIILHCMIHYNCNGKEYASAFVYKHQIPHLRCLSIYQTQLFYSLLLGCASNYPGFVFNSSQKA